MLGMFLTSHLFLILKIMYYRFVVQSFKLLLLIVQASKIFNYLCMCSVILHYLMRDTINRSLYGRIVTFDLCHQPRASSKISHKW